jgi:hypothetical protein
MELKRILSIEVDNSDGFKLIEVEFELSLGNVTLDRLDVRFENGFDDFTFDFRNSTSFVSYVLTDDDRAEYKQELLQKLPYTILTELIRKYPSGCFHHSGDDTDPEGFYPYNLK